MLKTKLEVVQGDMKGAGMQAGNGSASLAKQVQKEKGSEGQDPARDVADGGGLVGLLLPGPKVDANEQEEVRTYVTNNMGGGWDSSWNIWQFSTKNRGSMQMAFF